ncbi:MAG: alpha-mannosidase [Actinobacteria bacterium]|nr:alpha-mannosidase [Actinomycetota bacterium]
MEPVTVAIVPHTHWDREWYEPFQSFRVRLVGLLDSLLDLLERDLSYARFLLDGQTAVLDDYLEIRPEAAGRLGRLVASGRVQVGPWMILMDEFMVSGETIVRDLQMGNARAAELGGAMPVGYLPDMFGHIAQMPQILKLAGLEHTVVWRGVPAAIDQTAFWWAAPDGSRVRAEYLYGSYSNGRDLPDDAKALVARARGYEQELGSARLDGGGMLLMNGTDHQLPQPWLGRVVAEANDLQDGYRFAVTSLAEFLPAQPVDGINTWSGELRSGARANVLMGVASNRVDVHQACAAAERALERRAEPISALFLAADRYPTRLLQVGWSNLVLNSAHDSSCACSHDEVVDAVTVRYQEARHIGDSLARDAMRRLATEVISEPGSTIVVNSTQHDRGGLVYGFAPGEGPLHFVTDDGATCPAQVLRTVGGDGFHQVVTGQKVRWVLEMMRGPEFAGSQIARVTPTQSGDNEWEYVFEAARAGEAVLDLEATREEILALGQAGATVRFRQVRAPAREFVFAADTVPGFGWRTYRAVDGDGPSTALRGDDHSIANEHLEVVVDPADGTFSVTTNDGVTVHGLDRLVDGGDGGDTYSYSPPAQDRLVDAPTRVTVTLLEPGPLRARLLIERTYEWPRAAVGDAQACTERSDNTVPVDVRTELELRSGERFVRVHTTLDNRARDHRLRAHFPLPAAVDGSDAECAFTVVHRGLEAEGGPHEFGLPTFVSRRFVDCSDGSAGLAVLHDGLLEYEVVDDGRELALTMLRATGYLSRIEPSLRPNPAGPPDELEGPQLQRVLSFDYAVLPHRGDWRAADLYAAADELLVPLERVRGDGVDSAHRPPSGQELSVDGAQVSAVVRDGIGLVVRVFNASPEPSVATVERHGPVQGWIIDLLGRPVSRFEGTVDLHPWEIATLRLD